MVFAVPTFAVIYYYFRKHVEHNLAERGLPEETSAYETKDNILKKETVKKKNNKAKKAADGDDK